MGETQITFPVWNSHHDLSWATQRSINGIPQALSQLLLEWLGSPVLLYRLREEIVDIIRDMPPYVSSRPLVEIDICLSEKAANFLEETTRTELYRIGHWLTNQFSSMRFQEIIGYQTPNVVVHLWRNDGSIELQQDYRIAPSWPQYSVTNNKLKLKLILPIAGNQINNPQLFIPHSPNAITSFGIEELAKLLSSSVAKIARQYPFIAKAHLEIASTNSWRGSERLWVRHHAYHETWKISENPEKWASIPRDAWTPVLNGNILVIGRALPMPQLEIDITDKKMFCLPGSLLIRVVSHE